MTPPKGKIFPENPLKYAQYHPKKAIFSKNSLYCLEFMKKKLTMPNPPIPAFGRIYTHGHDLLDPIHAVVFPFPSLSQVGLFILHNT